MTAEDALSRYRRAIPQNELGMRPENALALVESLRQWEALGEKVFNLKEVSLARFGGDIGGDDRLDCAKSETLEIAESSPEA